MGDFKSRVQKAMLGYHQRESDKSLPKETRRNKSPEKDVEFNCLHWMRQMGWSVQIFESKATYNPQAGTYTQQAMKQGTADCIGCDANGTFVAIEFKAKGRKSTLRPQQRKFLIEKLEHNAFAVCVESAEELAKLYTLWIECVENPTNRRETFIKFLPCKRHKEHANLFD